MILDGNENVTQIAASVMTARSPALRVQLGSRESKRLKGINATEDYKRGSEFCVFPLIHSQKVLGVLNITGYSSFALGDPSQMDLFLSITERLLPKLAETYYRQDLSPMVDEQKLILEVESKYNSSKTKNKQLFADSITALAKTINCKIITSEAFPAQDCSDSAAVAAAVVAAALFGRAS